jgi:hypothetical protein
MGKDYKDSSGWNYSRIAADKSVKPMNQQAPVPNKHGESGWICYTPKIEAVMATLGDELGNIENPRLSIHREIARLSGDSQYHLSLVDSYMKALNPEDKPNANQVKLLRKSRWREAIRVFSFFPHPELEKQSAGDIKSNTFEAREMYVSAGSLLISAELDLPILRRYFGKTYKKAAAEYADLARARYLLIGKLQELGAMPLGFTAAGFWLCLEYELAKIRFQNIGKTISITENTKNRAKYIQSWKNMALENRTTDPHSRRNSPWEVLAIAASSIAATDKGFMRNHYIPWLNLETKWNSAHKRSKLHPLTTPRPRGPSHLRGNCYAM